MKFILVCLILGLVTVAVAHEAQQKAKRQFSYFRSGNNNDNSKRQATYLNKSDKFENDKIICFWEDANMRDAYARQGGTIGCRFPQPMRPFGLWHCALKKPLCPLA